MWQRIKQAILQHPTFAPLPLFAKMVLLYSSIVFFILIVVSVITVASIHYIMNDSIKEDLESSAQNTVAYLDSYGKVDSSVFVRSNLPNFVTLQIYNGAGKLVLDNCPTHTIKKLSDRHIDEDIQDKTVNALPTTIQGSETTEFSYYKKWDGDDGKSYYLRFSRQPDKENDFITLLSKQLLASILICLALTVLTGMYLMKKSLAPLRIINDTLETIEVNQLDNRICLLWSIGHNQHLWYMNIIFINILPHSLALHTAGLLIILSMLVIYNEIQLVITIEMNIQLALLRKIQQILNHCFIQIGSIKLLATSSLNESTIVSNNWHIQLQLLSIRQGGGIHSACSNSKDYPCLYSPLNHMLVALRNLVLIVEQCTIHICNK